MNPAQRAAYRDWINRGSCQEWNNQARAMAGHGQKSNAKSSKCRHLGRILLTVLPNGQPSRCGNSHLRECAVHGKTALVTSREDALGVTCVVCRERGLGYEPLSTP